MSDNWTIVCIACYVCTVVGRWRVMMIKRKMNIAACASVVKSFEEEID